VYLVYTYLIQDQICARRKVATFTQTWQQAVTYRDHKQQLSNPQSQ